MPNDLLGEIHSSTATTSPDWATFRSEVTGMYLLSGQGGEWDAQHLIREYNRNINSLYTSWTETEPNATGLFLEPYNAGFSYQGTGDFRDYKWDTYSLAFDGVDDYLSVGASNLIITSNIFSISMWFKIGDTSAGDERIFVNNAAGGGTNVRIIIDTNGKVKAGHWNGSGVTELTGGSAVDDGNWHHVVFTSTASAQALYIDGSSVATASTTFSSRASSSVVTTVAAHVATSSYAAMNADEVAVWDSVLSAAQVLAIYNGGTPESLVSYSPLAWWRMGDGPLDDGNVAGNGLIGDQVNPTLGSELVPNGDMELDDNWNDLGSPTTNERSTEKVYSGKYSRKCVANGASEGLQSDTFSLVAGTVYKVSFYYYLEIAAGPTSRWIMKLKDGDGSDLNPSHNLTVTGAWTNVTFYTTATATGSSSYIQLFQSLGGDSTFYLDNVSVKPVNGKAGLMENMTASDIVADTP